MDKIEIEGRIDFPDQWTVFGLLAGDDTPLPLDRLTEIPDRIRMGDRTIPARRVTPTRHQYDFSECFGAPPYHDARVAYVFIPLQSETEQAVTFGFGADWTMEVWLNGTCILDTTAHGNRRQPPLIDDFCVTAPVRAGDNLLAVRFRSGTAGAVLAIGGPAALRGGDYRSILPDPRHMTAKELAAVYPPDPEAPIRWVPPEGFDPRIAGLGLPPLRAAEHEEIFHALPSNAAIEDGGSGVYESVRHGTFNHNLELIKFRECLIAVWTNQAVDEGGYGSRRLACAGRILDEAGHVDWHRDDTPVQLTEPAMPVRRRKRVSDRDVIRSAEALGHFRVIRDRLFLFGFVGAIHGVTTTDGDGRIRRSANQPVPHAHFFFGKRSTAPRGRYLKWRFGLFFQEWDLVNGRLQPVSPVYKKSAFPTNVALTPERSLPLETLAPVYRDAPLLADAPADFRLCIDSAQDRLPPTGRMFPPGMSHLAQDGLNGINPGHSTQFQRPDGSFVLIVENSKLKYFYYASERMTEDRDVPPPRRTSLYGSVNPTSGRLEDGSVFIVANSPDRRNMFITVSRDGRSFDKTWLLLYKSLKNNTPGMHKAQGGTGSGPQYFQCCTVGHSLWLVYSIAKEHIGATRIPLEELK